MTDTTTRTTASNKDLRDEVAAAMQSMFCFQCEQTAGGTGCTGRAGVCGKPSEVANLQDELTGAMVGLARAWVAKGHDTVCDHAAGLVERGLFATLTNVDFDAEDVRGLIASVRERSAHAADGAANVRELDMREVWDAPEDVRSLKSLLLFGLRGIAAYAYHARVLGKTANAEVDTFVMRALKALGDDLQVPELLDLVLEAGRVNTTCLRLLDEGNVEAFGSPVPTQVELSVEPGPFVVISGHDLRDLEQLLEQTDGRGVNVYTHGEMLPAHAYPRLKAHPQLKGNFGGAWYAQQRELDGIPAPVVFTTNCLMPPRASYSDRVFTTGPVAYPGMARVAERADGAKDFSAVIDKALELGGYAQRQERTGSNGGSTVTTGFAHDAVMSVAGQVIEAVKSGAVKHIFLVGGCDGARAGRSYYTDFVKATPADSLVLTLACGKYRFNDLDLGTVGGLPRLLDMGQCNDAYSAVVVALALAEAFGCTVNELPLSIVLSWYEQKAVAVLLSLLSLGIKGIYLGPTLPAFASPAVLDVLVGQFGLHPTTTPEADLAAMLGR